MTLTAHQSPTRRPEVDVRVVTGERVSWRPVRPGETGYVCDANVLGKRGAWFAIDGRPVLTPERVVVRLAQRIGPDDDLGALLRELLEEDRQALLSPPPVETQGSAVVDISLDVERGETRLTYTEESAKNLADGVRRIPEFVEALRDPSLGHKAVAERFPFTSETSVRRWRKAEGVEVAR